MYRLFVCALLLIISHGYGLYLNHGFGHDFGPDHFSHGYGHDLGPYHDHSLGPNHHHGFGHDFGPDHGDDSGDDSSGESGDDSGSDSGDDFGDDSSGESGNDSGDDSGSDSGDDSGDNDHDGWGPNSDASRSHEHDHKNVVDSSHHQQTEFEKLSQHLAAANKVLQNSCNRTANIKTRVIIGMDFYALKYSLQEFSEDSIGVKVKNNVLSVTATHSSLGNFKDLRILPHFVRVSDATWYFEEGVLRILFPYKNALKTEVVLLCDEADDSVINIPKQEVSHIDLRFLGPLE